jgi:hypothetical protein
MDIGVADVRGLRLEPQPPPADVVMRAVQNSSSEHSRPSLSRDLGIDPPLGRIGWKDVKTIWKHYRQVKEERHWDAFERTFEPAADEPKGPDLEDPAFR